MKSPLKRAHILLAPGVPDLAALGAEGGEDLLGTGRLEGEARAELVARERGAARWRVPLPGTPGPDGRRLGRPRGAGTGWIWVERFERPPLAELLRARFTHPRSTSLAARAWNLLCHLRAHGVPTPEPLAVCEERGEPFSPRSALVVRELARASPLPEWLAGARSSAQRRGAARALGLLLARLARAGIALPELTLADVHVSVPKSQTAGPSPAGAGSRDPSPVPGLRLRGLPELALVRVRGGRIGRGAERARRAQLEGLALRSSSQAAFSTRELLAVWYRARGRGLPRRQRRAELARSARRLSRSLGSLSARRSLQEKP